MVLRCENLFCEEHNILEYISHAKGCTEMTDRINMFLGRGRTSVIPPMALPDTTTAATSSSVSLSLTPLGTSGSVGTLTITPAPSVLPPPGPSSMSKTSPTHTGLSAASTPFVPSVGDERLANMLGNIVNTCYRDLKWCCVRDCNRRCGDDKLHQDGGRTYSVCSTHFKAHPELAVDITGLLNELRKYLPKSS